ncbi:MAG: hypothetical protein ACQETI_09105 [Halobacteriota archaeon]
MGDAEVADEKATRNAPDGDEFLVAAVDIDLARMGTKFKNGRRHRELGES